MLENLQRPTYTHTHLHGCILHTFIGISKTSCITLFSYTRHVFSPSLSLKYARASCHSLLLLFSFYLVPYLRFFLYASKWHFYLYTARTRITYSPTSLPQSTVSKLFFFFLFTSCICIDERVCVLENSDSSYDTLQVWAFGSSFNAKPIVKLRVFTCYRGIFRKSICFYVIFFVLSSKI